MVSEQVLLSERMHVWPVRPTYQSIERHVGRATQAAWHASRVEMSLRATSFSPAWQPYPGYAPHPAPSCHVIGGGGVPPSWQYEFFAYGHSSEHSIGGGVGGGDSGDSGDNGGDSGLQPDTSISNRRKKSKAG